MDIKIVGLAGSPRKGRNSEFLLKKALEAAEEQGHTKSLPGKVETEMLSLATLKVGFCKGCNRCDRSEENETRFCPAQDDDLQLIVEKMLTADGLIFSVPLYIGGMTAQMKAFIDRLEVIGGASQRKHLFQGFRNKVAGTIVQGTFRNGGQEITWMSFMSFFMYRSMIPVGTMEGHNPSGAYGGMGVGYPHGGSLSKGNALEKDELGIHSCRLLGRRVALVAKMLKPYAALEREEFIEWYRSNPSIRLDRAMPGYEKH
jgi:multimeric flavodoxin WrbA